MVPLNTVHLVKLMSIWDGVDCSLTQALRDNYVIKIVDSSGVPGDVASWRGGQPVGSISWSTIVMYEV